MDALAGWLVIGCVGFLVWRAVRKWRREWKQGLTAAVSTSASEAVASSMARADVGGIHLHINAPGLGASGGNDYDALGAGNNYDDRSAHYDYDIAADNNDDNDVEVRELVQRLAGLLSVDQRGTEPVAIADVLGPLARRLPAGRELHAPADRVTP